MLALSLALYARGREALVCSAVPQHIDCEAVATSSCLRHAAVALHEGNQPLGQPPEVVSHHFADRFLRLYVPLHFAT